MRNPGFKTSEFWVAAVTSVVALLNQFLGLGIDAEQMAMALAPAAAYILSRGWAKSNG